MNVFNEIIQLMLDLTDEQLEKVRAFILTKLKIIVNPISVEIRKCPYCNGWHIVKNGKNKGSYSTSWPRRGDRKKGRQAIGRLSKAAQYSNGADQRAEDPVS